MIKTIHKKIVAISLATSIFVTNSFGVMGVGDVVHDPLSYARDLIGIQSSMSFQQFSLQAGAQNNKIASMINSTIGYNSVLGVNVGKVASDCINDLMGKLKIDLFKKLDLDLTVCGNDIGNQIVNSLENIMMDYINKKLKEWAGNPGIKFRNGMFTLNGWDAIDEMRAQWQRDYQTQTKDELAWRKAQKQNASKNKDAVSDMFNTYFNNLGSTNHQDSIKTGQLDGKQLSAASQTKLAKDEKSREERVTQQKEVMIKNNMDTSRVANLNEKYGVDDINIDPDLRGKYIIGDDLLETIYVLYSTIEKGSDANLGDYNIYAQAVVNGADPRVKRLVEFSTPTEQAKTLLFNLANVYKKETSVESANRIRQDQLDAIAGLNFISIAQQNEFFRTTLNQKGRENAQLMGVLESVLHELQEINVLLRTQK